MGQHHDELFVLAETDFVTILIQYISELDQVSQFELFNTMFHKNIYVHRARESRQVPFSSAVDYRYWLSIGGTQSELEAYDRWRWALGK